MHLAESYQNKKNYALLIILLIFFHLLPKLCFNIKEI